MSNSLFRARRLWGRPLIKEMRVGKMARGWGGVGSSVYFSRPSLPTNSKPTTGSRRPAETINTKVSGKVNLIFYMINLFPIRSLVDKAQKIEKLSFVGSCRIFYYHSSRCHAMRIQLQYANLSRILQF